MSRLHLPQDRVWNEFIRTREDLIMKHFTKRKQHTPWKATLAKLQTRMLRKAHVVKVTVRNPGKRPLVRELHIHPDMQYARVNCGIREY